MVNDCIRIGLETGTSSMKSLCVLSYHDSEGQVFHSSIILPPYGDLKGCWNTSGKKEIPPERNKNTKPVHPKPVLVSCYNFKIIGNQLVFSIYKGKHVKIFTNQS